MLLSGTGYSTIQDLPLSFRTDCGLTLRNAYIESDLLSIPHYKHVWIPLKSDKAGDNHNGKHWDIAGS